jgi:mono/diheme cytochrome c family protein
MLATMTGWATRPLITAWGIRLIVVFSSLFILSCVKAQPASDTGDPGFPFGPSAIGVQPIAYVQDIKPIFDRDCASCHGGRGDDGGYSVRTYADTVAGQRPGDASSPLVVDCAPGGSMYGYFSGDAVTRSTMVFRWMVVYNAAQSR